uniref:Uncharacterized protein n=1 Tax=Clostridioides difficile TaxID=1496 RepID=A0A5E4DPN0_CLODI|nr:hypothetical protein [Clostridioides difficile]VUB78605.1 Hypothetical protein CDSMR_0004 [Clostridioides difficile]
MKVTELIELLKECDPNAEIRVLFPLPNRPIGGTLEPIFEIKPCIDQDSNKTHYVIDTGIGEEGCYKASQQKP